MLHVLLSLGRHSLLLALSCQLSILLLVYAWTRAASSTYSKIASNLTKGMHKVHWTRKQKVVQAEMLLYMIYQPMLLSYGDCTSTCGVFNNYHLMTTAMMLELSIPTTDSQVVSTRC